MTAARRIESFWGFGLCLLGLAGIAAGAAEERPAPYDGPPCHASVDSSGAGARCERENRVISPVLEILDVPEPFITIRP